MRRQRRRRRRRRLLPTAAATAVAASLSTAVTRQERWPHQQRSERDTHVRTYVRMYVASGKWARASNLADWSFRLMAGDRNAAVLLVYSTKYCILPDLQTRQKSEMNEMHYASLYSIFLSGFRAVAQPPAPSCSQCWHGPGSAHARMTSLCLLIAQLLPHIPPSPPSPSPSALLGLPTPSHQLLLQELSWFGISSIVQFHFAQMEILMITGLNFTSAGTSVLGTGWSDHFNQ